MIEVNLSATAISIYGACLSTVLGLWQFWRAYQERRWITTSYYFRETEDPGNEILLINNSPRPQTLYHIQLFWGRRILGWTRRYKRVGDDPWGDLDSDAGLTIDPYKILILRYGGERHFGWRYDSRPKARLYIQLNIVGWRRRKIIFVYKQDNRSLNILQKLFHF